MQTLKSFPFRKAKEAAKNILKRQSGQSTEYSWPCIRAILNKTKLLAEKMSENGVEINMENLMLSVLGHAIVQLHNIDKTNYTADDVRKFEEILHNSEYTEKRIEKILQVISECSSKTASSPKIFEAKLLWLAEKWNKLGPKGTERTIAYGKQQKIPEKRIIQQYKEKIEKTKPLFIELVKEIPGSEIALTDLRYSIKFIEEFEKNNSKQVV